MTESLNASTTWIDPAGKGGLEPIANTITRRIPARHTVLLAIRVRLRGGGGRAGLEGWEGPAGQSYASDTICTLGHSSKHPNASNIRCTTYLARANNPPGGAAEWEALPAVVQGGRVRGEAGQRAQGEFNANSIV